MSNEKESIPFLPVDSTPGNSQTPPVNQPIRFEEQNAITPPRTRGAFYLRAGVAAATVILLLVVWFAMRFVGRSGPQTVAQAYADAIVKKDYETALSYFEPNELALALGSQQEAVNQEDKEYGERKGAVALAPHIQEDEQASLIIVWHHANTDVAQTFELELIDSEWLITKMNEPIEGKLDGDTFIASEPVSQAPSDNQSEQSEPSEQSDESSSPEQVPIATATPSALPTVVAEAEATPVAQLSASATATVEAEAEPTSVILEETPTAALFGTATAVALSESATAVARQETATAVAQQETATAVAWQEAATAVVRQHTATAIALGTTTAVSAAATPLPPAETPSLEATPTPTEPSEAAQEAADGAISARIDLRGFDSINVRDLDGYTGTPYAQVAFIDNTQTTFNALARSPDGLWIYVSLADGTIGWIASEYVVASQPLSLLPDRAPLAAPEIGASITLSTYEFINVRASPSLDASVVTEIYDANTRFAAVGLSQDTEWVLVRLSDGTLGWILGEFVLGDQSLDDLPRRFYVVEG